MDIYTLNKYTNTYFSIVNRSLCENRSRKDDRQYEQHHIIPKSCGGTDDQSNLVLLTPKEHYICHRLLPKMVKSKLHYEKMVYALWAMVNGNGRAERYSPSGKIYQQIKEEHAIVRSDRMKGSGNHFFGKTHTQEMKKSFSENNPSKRKEVKAKMRGPRPDFKPHSYYFGHSEETKQKLREANLGKTHSEESKQKMSITRADKMWVKKDGEKSKHIQSSDLQQYLTDGWSLGRHLGKQKKKKEPYSDEYKAKMSMSLSKKIWISKTGCPPKFIDKDEESSYLIDGWVRGRRSL